MRHHPAIKKDRHRRDSFLKRSLKWDYATFGWRKWALEYKKGKGWLNFLGGELKGGRDTRIPLCAENGCENPTAQKKCPFYLWMGGAVSLFVFSLRPEKKGIIYSLFYLFELISWERQSRHLAVEFQKWKERKEEGPEKERINSENGSFFSRLIWRDRW